jgi:hypothetical protein
LTYANIFAIKFKNYQLHPEKFAYMDYFLYLCAQINTKTTLFYGREEDSVGGETESVAAGDAKD